MYDAVLLIAFGGPRSPEEVRPFLERVAQGRNIPQQRLEQVENNYRLVGGRSPLLEITLRQARRLEAELYRREQPLPVFVGMRNWHPFLYDTLALMRSRGVRKAIGVILSPQESEPGWHRYIHDVAKAQAAMGAGAPVVHFVPPWHDRLGFVHAVACQAARALSAIPEADRASTPLVFTAHSLPTAMAHKSSYVAQLRGVAGAVCEVVGHKRWLLAFQSRSGPETEPWLEPDISDCLTQLARERVRHVVVVPVGFVCDHVEVLYDLDVVARATAQNLGIHMLRAATVGDHAAFVGMLADLVCEQIQHENSGSVVKNP